jgi:hypothetical protein
MNHKLSKSLISSTDFYNHYENSLKGSTNYDRAEFFDVCGRQHLSTCFDDAIIIDIGTHRGQSAMALSYNPTNTIHTFDIENRVTNDHIKNVSNISFHMDNLFEIDGRKPY